jgi:PadR family transcriptional regulator, regulatory protein PadR
MVGKPMTGQAFFVLTALADGPRHGYGIVGEVAELSGGRVKLKIGSLYGALERLADEGLIEHDREEAHDGRLRRYYRLTRDGRRALAEEAELRAAAAGVASSRLGPTAARAADERRPGSAVQARASAAARLVPAAHDGCLIGP